MNKWGILLFVVCGLALATCGRRDKAGEDIVDAGDHSSTPDGCVPYCGEEGEAQCGDDGCGGTCGECEPGAICGEADYEAIGICFDAAKECPERCDQANAECGFVWNGLWEPEGCDCGECPDGLECVEEGDEAGWYCAEPECVSDGCPEDKCWASQGLDGGLGDACESDEDCLFEFCRAPAGGGGQLCTCPCTGDCPDAYSCAQAVVVGPDMEFDCFPSCMPDCDGKECGPDGCGGSCGECWYTDQCSDDGVCICIPDCGDQTGPMPDCGPDGCGGYCECPGEGGECLEKDCWEVGEGPEGFCWYPEDGCPAVCEVVECGEYLAVIDANGQGTCDCGDCPGPQDQCVDNTCVCQPEDEFCDGIDNDCDGDTDEGLGTTTCGLGACEHVAANCSQGQSAKCDPFEGATPDLCDVAANGVDDDCDGQVDEVDAEGCTPFWVDEDGDGWAGTQACYCDKPPNTKDSPGDCCDADPQAFPGQTKYFALPVSVCGGFDYNCDGAEQPQYKSSCVEAPCSSGWFQPAPACGAVGEWCLNCAGCGSCIGQTILQEQKCQ